MGKKSGPLAFLNKKGWHPGNQRNQEKVWKKEQEALAEKKQVEELRKQYDEARQKEEVEAMAVAAGVKKKQERLDWMYQGGMVAKQEAEKRQDAQMLGEKEVDLPLVEEPSKAEHVAQLPAFYTQDTPASANEMWQKLHGDPMFAIKQQELMARKNIVANPVQMDAIKKKLQERAEAKAAKKAAKAEAKAAKKAAKKAKKEKKRKRVVESSSSDLDSEASEEDRSPKRVRSSNGKAIISQAGRKMSPPPGPDRHRSGRDQNGHSAEPRSGRGHHERDRDHDHGFDRDRRDHRSHRDYDSRRESRGHRLDRNGRDADRLDRHRHDERGRRESSRHENGHRTRDDREALSPARGNADRAEIDSAEDRRADPEVKIYRDAASAQGRDLSYGLNAATNAAEVDRTEKRRETQKRLEEAKLRREAEDKEKAEQRYKRKEHKTGQISEEEKARRLAEMSGNADAHEEARWARLQAARKRDEVEAEAEALALQKKATQSAQPGTQHHQDTAKFLQQATQEAFGGEAASLADRVSRRKYYNDRNRDESQGAFRRE